MNAIFFLPWCLLLALLAAALWQDIISRRIPNRLVLAGLLAGLACNALLSQGAGLFMADAGGLGLGKALLGMLAGGAMLLPLYLLRAMGAGDVKLMAVVGAFLGPLQAFGAALLTFLAGGLLALAAALFARSLPQVLNNLRLMLLYLASGREAGLRVSDAPTSGRLPYAVAIAIGTLLQLLLARVAGWPFGL
ncbi:prepilin peptidase [Uliginosibacterium sp. 31-16]|uniref:prepilin peptidase n=1 Tax=Uliginosibacterium sp. 31-16 TaxID=3068315 RepID=UPI00273E0C08|nr:prepilin peptidase [Uliginosibacterium sp. 31-16]MDP5238042.1 prepilin peptidase [Uliginosibacterium sp. 31-16]